MRFATLALALLLNAAPALAQVSWMRLDPMAVRADRTEPVAIEIQTTATVAALRLDYFRGGSLPLTSHGSGRWTASIPAAKVLDGYESDDVNHNVIGYIRFLDASGTTTSSFNLVIHVIDDRVPAARIRMLDAGARATDRILNVHRSGIGPTAVAAAVREFYTYFRDDFDFVQVVFSTPIHPSNRYHFTTRNDVAGIGKATIDVNSQYGSAGRLLGITVFPIDTYFDCGESAFSHELGHQWIQFLKNPALAAGSPHWPPSTMGRGIMGANITGGVGGTFPYAITPVTSSTARVRSATAEDEFTDLDLYLMGFIPASEVKPGIVVHGSPCNDCVLPSTTITIEDVIAINGVRVPDSTTAPKSFRTGTIVVSRDRLLTDDELSVLEYFAARGEATTPLPYTSGLTGGMTKPFHVATRGIGRVDFRLTSPTPPRRRAAAK